MLPFDCGPSYAFHCTVIRPLILGPGWVKVWVNQSRGLPLDLYLNFKIFVVPPPTKSGQFMETTLDFGHKLRLLNLKGHISVFLPLFRLPRSSLPQLEQAYLEISSYATQDEMQVTANLLRLQVPQQIETFVGASKLQHIDNDSQSLVLPVKQLS